MPGLAPQSVRTFFVTTNTWGRRSLFQPERMASLLIDVLADNRKRGRFWLHEFVIMPDHIHVLLTPAFEIPLERAVQFIKGGYYAAHRSYIHENPAARKGLRADYPLLCARDV